ADSDLQAGDSLHEGVVAGKERPRAGRTEGAGMAIDSAGVDAGDARLVDAQALGDADSEVVEDDGGPLDQSLDNRTGLERPEVERQAGLAPLAGGYCIRGGPHRLALGGLDLDDVGTQVAEYLCAQRSGEEGREVEHVEARKQLLRVGRANTSG